MIRENLKRRSFISLISAASLLRIPLWGRENHPLSSIPWGPLLLNSARAEQQRVVLSFTPIEGAESYRIQIRHVERHTFTSQLGEIHLQPYYVLTV